MLKRFIKDLLIYLPSKFLPALTGLITVPLLTRIFLPAEYGNWALATGLADFLVVLACSGVGPGGFRFFPAYEARAELSFFYTSLIASSSLIIGAVSVISLLALVFFRTSISAALYPLLMIGLLTFVIQSLFSIFADLLRVKNRSALFTWLNLIVNYGSLGLGLILVLAFGLRIEGFMWGTLAVSACVLPFVFRATLHGVSLNLKYLRTSDLLALWHFGWPLTLGSLAMWGLRLSDRFILGFFRTEAEVGLYSAVYNISDKTILMLVTLFLLSMGPVMINTWENQGREATEAALAMITRLFLIVCLPITVGLSVLALPFITLLTGEAYHEGYRIVGYVAFSTFIFGLSRIAGWGLLVNNKTSRFAINQILAAGVNLALNFLLVPRYGFIAAGLTTLIGYALLLFLQAYTSQAYLTWKLPGRMLFNLSIAASVMGLLVFGMNTFALQNGEVQLPQTFFIILAGALFYFSALWFLGEISPAEKVAIKHVFQAVLQRPA